MKAITAVTGVAVLLTACAHQMQSTTSDSPETTGVVPVGMTDADLKVPADYRTWPSFLSGIDKEEGKQIRDIYINDTGHAAGRGQSFPNGTMSVMELWKAKTAADGTLQRGPDGRLIKDELALIFVMAKSEGAGARVAPELRTGDWVYAGYKADGVTTGGPPVATCRTCHLQAVATDWVFRVDEYRDKHRF